MKNYQKIVLASAWYDLLLTAPFAFPFTQQTMLYLLTFLHQQMNLHANIPIFLPEHQQFVSLSG